MRQELWIGARERWLNFADAVELRPDPSPWLYMVPVGVLGSTFLVPEEWRIIAWGAALLAAVLGTLAFSLFLAAWVLDGAVAYAAGRCWSLRSNQARATSAALHACQGQPPAR